MSTGATRRVLVVDDSIVVRHVLILTLRQIPGFYGAQIDEAGDGEAALAQMAENRYDLVLSDVRMPSVDGLELVRRIRGELGDTRTPIFLVSTLGSKDDVRRGLAAGATAYIVKPLSPHIIMKTIEEYFSSGVPPRHRRGA